MRLFFLLLVLTLTMATASLPRRPLQFSKHAAVEQAAAIANHIGLERERFGLLEHTTIYSLHIPKAGTSFITILLHYCSPTLDESLMPEQAMWEQVFVKILEQNATYSPALWTHCRIIAQGHGNAGLRSFKQDNWVGMFRHPLARLRSAYLNDLHSEGFSNKKRAELHASIHTLKEFVETPGITGCQTRMLTGYACASLQSPADKLERALNALSTRFVFMGLTERWTESMCLFHAMYGGRVLPVEFENAHPTDPTQYLTDADRLFLQSNASDVDPYDARVFDYVTRWFEEQLAVHHRYVIECVRNHSRHPSSVEDDVERNILFFSKKEQPAIDTQVISPHEFLDRKNLREIDRAHESQ